MFHDSDMLDAIAVIKVGPEKKEFWIHKGVLCRAGSFFQAALEGGFKEALEQTIEMPEADVGAFKQFLVWLYSGQFPDPMASSTEEANWDLFVQLYIFAETYGIPALQNDSIDVLCKLWELGDMFPSDIIKKAYKATPSNSPLRKFMVDVGLDFWKISETDLFREDHLSRCPKEWLADLLMAQHDIDHNRQRIGHSDLTKYHVKIESKD